MEQKTSLMPGWRKIAALLALTAAIGLLWHAAIDAYRSSVIEQHKRELASITEVKIQRVHAWLQEKRGDSAVLRGLTFIRDALSAPSPPAATQDILRQLELVRQAYSYDSILLFDRAGRLRLAVGDTTPDEIKAAGSGNADAAGPADIRISSFRPRKARAGRELMLQIDVPIPGVDSQAIAGHLVMLLPSHAAIDPLLVANTGRVKSNDIGILERQGKELHVLNTPRFSEPARLVLKADAPNLPSAMAARGVTGLVEGSDYRGEAVLAFIGRIPDVPWLIVSKRDKAEILAPVRMVALGSGTLTILLAIALGLSVQFFRRHQLAERTLAERMVAQQALAASEARFRKLIENAWDLLVLFDRDMRIAYASPSVEQQAGRNLVGESIASGTAMVHPEDVARVEAARANALAHPGVPQRFEHRVKGRYDHWMQVEASFTNHFDDPAIGALTYVGRDVSERKWADQALRDSEERYRFLFKLSPDAVFLHRNGVIFETNEAALRLFRAGSENTLIGRNWRELIVPERWPIIEQRIAALEKGEQAYLQPSEQRYRSLDGQTVEVEATAARIVVDGTPAILSVVRDISERKRAEAELKESEARYRFLFDSSPLPMWIYDIETLAFLEVNLTAVDQYGYSREEFLAMTLRDIRPPEEIASMESAARSDRRPQGLVWTHRRKDGSLIKVAIWSQDTPLFGRPARMVLAENVTARVEAEQSLAVSESTLRSFLDSIPGVAIVMDTEGTAHYANRLAADALGLKLEQMIGANAFSPLPPDVAARRIARAKQAMLENRIIRFEDNRDGRDIESFFCPIPDSRGIVFRLAVLAFDITQRKQAEQALQASEARLRAIFDSAPVGIAIANPDGRYLMVNRAQCRMVGYSEEELLQRTYADITHPEDVQSNLDLTARTQTGEISVGSMEKRYVRKDGTVFWVLLTVGLVRTASGDVLGSVGVAQDITERREAEAQRLEYARRQRDTLVREVHHRIKNHLQGLAGLLRQHMQEQPALEHVLQKFAAQIAAISIVHGLQGRLDQGDASLRNLVAEIAAFLGNISGTAIRLACPDHACYWAISEEEAVPVALVLNELLTNALRHGSDKGRIEVSMACEANGALVLIRHPGRLGAGLDFAGGKGLGTGLSLIRSLLPPAGAALSLGNTEDGWVEARLELVPPVLLPMDQQVSLR